MRSLMVGIASLNQHLPAHAGKRLFSGDAFRQLFVGGLSFDTNEAALKDAFEQHGRVIEVNVICDRVSGKSKGFGFVKFALASEAAKALQQMNGQMLDGRQIRLEQANRDRKDAL